jgi:hypothetical protein
MEKFAYLVSSYLVALRPLRTWIESSYLINRFSLARLTAEARERHGILDDNSNFHLLTHPYCICVPQGIDSIISRTDLHGHP